MRSSRERRQVLAHEVGPDRQLAVPAVDEHRESHGARPAEVVAARRGRRGCVRPEIQHVVDEDHGLAVDPAAGNVGRCRGARGIAREVVAVHRDVERADGHGTRLDAFENRADPMREHDAASGDAEKHETGRNRVGLEDLVRDPSQRSGDVSLLQHGACVILTSFPASLDGI